MVLAAGATHSAIDVILVAHNTLQLVNNALVLSVAKLKYLAANVAGTNVATLLHAAVAVMLGSKINVMITRLGVAL